MISTVIGGLVAGVVIGPLARLVLPGRQNISVGMTILVGAVGAIVGGFLSDALGIGATTGVDWIKLGVQVGVAAVAIWLYTRVARRSREVVIPER